LINFHIFLLVDSVRNLLLSGMHTTLAMSLQCFVKYKYKKPAIFTEMGRKYNGNF